MILEFYTMMLAEEAWVKVASIELLELTPEEKIEAGKPQEGPDGSKAKLPMVPSHRLVIEESTP